MAGDAWWATVGGFLVACQVIAAEPVAVELPLGGRVTGVVVDDGESLRVHTPLFTEPLELPAAVVVRPPDGEAVADAGSRPLPGLPGRVGLLTADGTRMYGCLGACADGRVGWQPLGGSRAVSFAADGAARIEYRGLDAVGGPGVVLVREGAATGWKVVDLAADGPAVRDGRLRVGDRVETCAEGAFGSPVVLRNARAESIRLLLVGPIGSVVRFGVARDGRIEEITVVRDESGLEDLAGAAARDVFDRACAVRQSLAGAASGGPAIVHLRSGESFACAVLAADDRGLRLRLSKDQETTLPSAGVRAVELSSAGVRPILRQKLTRLLTVPRSQQATPPTHVVRMSGGDYLRGRLVAIDADTVRFDVVGEVKELPRRDVARIIRLAAADERPPTLLAELSSRGGLPLVVVGSDGRRRAVAATGMDGGRLVGESPSLGTTVLPLDAAATVLVGGAIDDIPAADLPYAQWVVTPARPPAAGR
jgi:hypothetical protein